MFDRVWHTPCATGGPGALLRRTWSRRSCVVSAGEAACRCVIATVRPPRCVSASCRLSPAACLPCHRGGRGVVNGVRLPASGLVLPVASSDACVARGGRGRGGVVAMLTTARGRPSSRPPSRRQPHWIAACAWPSTAPTSSVRPPSRRSPWGQPAGRASDASVSPA